jgi:hypothetical protein
VNVSYPGRSWYFEQPGSTSGPFDHAGLRALASTNQLRRDSLLRGSDAPPGSPLFPAREVEGLFSTRERYVALILLGVGGKLGADRFYLGYPAAGVGRLVIGIVTFIAWIVGSSALGGSSAVAVCVLLAAVCFLGNVAWIVYDGVQIVRGRQLDPEGRIV